MDRFLYDKNIHHKRVKRKIHILIDFEISYLKPVIMDKLATFRYHAPHSQGRMSWGYSICTFWGTAPSCDDVSPQTINLLWMTLEYILFDLISTYPSSRIDGTHLKIFLSTAVQEGWKFELHNFLANYDTNSIKVKTQGEKCIYIRGIFGTQSKIYDGAFL